MSTFSDDIRSAEVAPKFILATTTTPFDQISGPNVNDAVIYTAVANTAAADTVTYTNAAHGQASVYTQRDFGAAAVNVAGASAALVNGNLVQANGTLGNLQDSGVAGASVSGLITQVGNVTTVAVTLTPTNMAAAYATPVQLIAAPGAGKVIIVQEASVYTASTGNTAYATGTAPIIQYDSTVHGGGTNAVGSGLVAGDITAASSQVRCLVGSVAALTGVTNKGIFFSNATGAYTAGTGTNVTFNLTYQTITATV